jgi:hypothetical protein
MISRWEYLYDQSDSLTQKQLNDSGKEGLGTGHAGPR